MTESLAEVSKKLDINSGDSNIEKPQKLAKNLNTFVGKIDYENDFISMTKMIAGAYRGQEQVGYLNV